MSPISIGILAIGMSIDAFVASLGQGATPGALPGARSGWTRVLRTSAIFGGVEAVAPLIGWGLGLVAHRYISAIDHWIAFGLLAGVGGRMVYHALARPATAPSAGPGAGPSGASRRTGWTVFATAVGTSIDAMAVGVSLALLDVQIVVVVIAVGLTTMAMTAIGTYAGGFLGQRVGRAAEVVGGIALVGLGGMILMDHLAA